MVNRTTLSFGDAYVPLTSYAQGSDGGGYAAQGGETLSSLAASLWGDASLWYTIAAANGLSGDMVLAAEQHIALPVGVVRSTNSAATFKPYDPAGRAPAGGDRHPGSTRRPGHSVSAIKCPNAAVPVSCLSAETGSQWTASTTSRPSQVLTNRLLSHNGPVLAAWPQSISSSEPSAV